MLDVYIVHVHNIRLQKNGCHKANRSIYSKGVLSPDMHFELWGRACCGCNNECNRSSMNDIKDALKIGDTMNDSCDCTVGGNTSYIV